MDIPLGFLFKKALGLVLMPLSVCLMLLALGLLYVVLRRSRDAVALFVLGAALLYAFSLNAVSGALVRPLERAYPALDFSQPLAAQGDIRWVVVLGSWHWTDTAIPAPSRLCSSAMFRLAEGMRVARHLPDSVLVLSGGRYKDVQSCAQAMAEAAMEMGFDPARMLVADGSLDTHDEALRVKDIVGQAPFVLVTSAAHMPRAVNVFRHQGLHPVPAPTDYQDKGVPVNCFPSPGNIETCHLAMHEYLGLAWAFLRGQLSLTPS